jgi:hypothetical protein
MQEQQEAAWREQEKEHRIKMLKTDRSTPEMRTTRDASTLAQIITDDDWDEMAREATDRIEAESDFIQNKYNKEKQRDSINQTMDYGLRRLARDDDVSHAMSESDFESARSGTSSSSSRASSSSNVGGPSSSSTAGATMAGRVGTALKIGGKGAWQAAKLGYGAWRGISGAMTPFVDRMGEAGNRIQDRHNTYFLPGDDPRPSSTSRAYRTPAIPREAPQVYNIATPVATPRPPPQPKRRSRTPIQQRPPPPLPPPPQRGRTPQRGRSPEFAHRVAPEIRAISKKFMRAYSGVDPGY